MSKEKTKPSFEEKDLGINPLTQSMEIPVRILRNKQNVVNIEDLNITDEEVIIAKQSSYENTYLAEKDAKGSYYCKAAYRLHVNSRTPKAKSLLLWLMYDIEYNKDYVWINIDRYLLETNTSINTYKEAVVELCREAIIAPIVGFSNMYWINPIIFFKGNRVKKYKNNIKIID